MPGVALSKKGLNAEVCARLYRNSGDRTFSDVAVQAGVASSGEGQEQAGMGTDFGDSDSNLEILASDMNDSPDLLRRTHKNGNHSILIEAIGTRGGFATRQAETCCSWRTTS